MNFAAIKTRLQALSAQAKTFVLDHFDKVKHLGVGLIVAALLFILMAFEHQVLGGWYIQHVEFFAILNGGILVHAAKEAEDRLDNLIMYHTGKPPMHGVEFLDFVAGTLGTLTLDLLLLWVGLV